MTKISAENSAKSPHKKPKKKVKRRTRGKAFQKENPFRFPPGKSGNPGGRPKLLGESYRAWLELADAKTGVTNAMRVAEMMGGRAATGDVSAARELRAATEGDKVRLLTWQTEIVDLLKAGKLTPDDVVRELGLDDARAILIAAGAALPARPSPEESGPVAGADTPAA